MCWVIIMSGEFISISPLTNNRQLNRDLQTILRIGQKYLHRQFDFLEWTSTLHVYGYIDENTHYRLQQRLLECSGTNREKSTIFIFEVLRYVSFDEFVEILYKQKQDDFAEELRYDRYRAVITMGRAEVPHSHFILKYYSNMKQMLDNNSFKDPKRKLKGLVIEFETKIRNSLDADNRQFNAEKLVAIFVLLLPQYSGYNRRKAMLDRMLRFFNGINAAHVADNDNQDVPTVDSTSAEIVYASKMAVTTAIAGNFDGARRFALEAECRGLLYRASLARTLANHDHQYIFRRQFMRTGQAKCLGKVLSIGDRGVLMLADEHDEVRNQWNRLFMLYKTLSLLGIMSDFSMAKQYPDPDKVEQAKQVLQEIRGSFDGIEYRREMIYRVCMARAHEITDVKKAITHADHALRLSEQCHEFLPKEKTNIKSYLAYLQRRCSLGWWYDILHWIYLYENIDVKWLRSFILIGLSILAGIMIVFIFKIDADS